MWRSLLFVCVVLVGCARPNLASPDPFGRDLAVSGFSGDVDMGFDPADLAGPDAPDLSRLLRDLSTASAPDLTTTAPADLAPPTALPDLATKVVPDLASSGCSTTQHLVVNEVQTGGLSSASDEFIELYNPCSQTAAAVGWKVVYRSASGSADAASPVITLTADVPGNGYVLIAGPHYSGAADYSYSTGGLADTGGGVGLRDGSGALVDAVGWGNATNAFVEGSAASAPPAGKSIGRHPNGHDSGDNGADFVVGVATPHAANP